MLKPSLHPVRDTRQTGGWTHSPFLNVLPQAGPGEMLAPCDFPVLGKGRDRQGDKESEEQKEGDRDGGQGVRGGERQRGSEGREGEEAEETLLNAACEHRSTSTWKQAGLNHPQNMPL